MSAGPASSGGWQREREVAEAAVVAAARLTKGVLRAVSEVSKQDASPVTVADFAAQALLIAALRAAFPGDAFVGEEDSGLLRRDAALRDRVYELFSAAAASAVSVDEMLGLIDLGGRGAGGPDGRFWVMDPVDGTAAFLRGEQYAVSLALVQDGHEVVGVLACPNLKLDPDGRVSESSVDSHGLGIMLSAARGHGVNLFALPSSPDSSSPPAPVPRRLQRLEPPRGLGHVHVVDCHLNPPSSRAVMQQLAARLGAPFPGTDVWSSHVRYAALVVGGGHALVRIPAGSRGRSCIWDHAGAQLIYAEVGGRATDLDGRAIDFGAGRYLSRNRGLVVAHADIHDKILSLAQELTRKEEEPDGDGSAQGHL
ncbi:inositol monophosphatase family protein [Hirsutella rhossiliensis]|uniref:Inositol monophosphatase family domain-containing protein n=1 Tax=Hirsutella rhossiliensis TaxID=111463 RepID=A0A9P8SHK5_9HYPO|nr:inositol monophosphatase family domain-containing protein [Hirsutella rhossiliensis]KAH0963213.1 inositol monophosphatase family domain-containing protein [Hirsutella rhossiliensis]